MAAPGFNIGASIPNLPVIGQTFRNIPIPNFRPCIYGMAIRNGQSKAITDTFIFPLSPESVRTEYNALTNVFDVSGNASTYGVTRIVDQYGNTPPIITIEGTTGWQYHGQDGYHQSGLDAIQNLEDMLNQYAQGVATEVRNGATNLDTMEFYDFFRSQYWEIIPMGRYGVRQDRNRPLIANYFFRFAATRALNGPNIGATADEVALAFSLTQTQAAQNANINLVQMGTYYAAQTYASFIISS